MRTVNSLLFGHFSVILVRCPFPRVKQEAEREQQRSPGIDVKRQAALFAEKAQKLNATRLASFAGDHRANANATSPSKINDSTLAQEILGECDESYPLRRRGRKRRETKAAYVFRRGGRDAKPKLDRPKEQCVSELRSERGRQESTDAPSEAANSDDMMADILHEEESLLNGEGTGSPRRSVAGGGGVGRVPVERVLRDVGGDGKPDIDGVDESGDDCDIHSYGQESFESAEDVTEDEVVASSARGGSNSEVGADNGPSDAVDESIEDDSRCIEYSYPRKVEAGRLSEENAAALKIETCWRGFLGRTDAKRALRSVLLCCLRKLGGGRVSKVSVKIEARRNRINTSSALQPFLLFFLGAALSVGHCHHI